MKGTKYKIQKEKLTVGPSKKNTAVFDAIREKLNNPYFKAKNFLLYKGDVLETLSFFPKDCIDLIFADPPYLLSNGGFTCQAGRRVSVNKGKWDKSNGLKKDFEFHAEWI